MKLLYLLPSFPRISEKFILDEINALLSHGVEIEIVSVHSVKEAVSHQAARSLPVFYYNDLQFAGLVEFVKRREIMHIHSHFASEATAIAHRLHEVSGVSFSFTTHAYDLYKFLRPALLQWSKDAVRVFTISEHNQRFLSDHVGVDSEKIVVSRCGVFPEELQATTYSASPFRIISASRFVEKKGLRFLIAACRELKRRGIAFECEIVGDGSESISELIKEFGLTDQIVLKGAITHPEIVDFLNSGSVFVLPCIQAEDGDMDGIPVTLMEAMALRVPVISTRLSGIPDLISDRENGLLVDPKNVESLVNAIVEIKQDSQLVERIRGRSRERIQQSYSVRANTLKMISALQLGFPKLHDYDLPEIRFCNAAQSGFASMNFEGIHNIFNPSLYLSDHLKIVAFRGIPEGDDRLTSYLSVQEKLINISAYCHSLNRLQLIDPRVFRLGEEVWLTFNSGFEPGGNDIFVMPIYPQIGRPKKVVFEGRRAQERNWAFFARDDEIYALYWINPLKVLKLKQCNDDTWEFEEFYSQKTDTHSALAGLSLGTQLAEYDGRYYFMGHRKYIAEGKKLYLGRSACLDFDNKSVVFGNSWFAHSKESLHGVTIKHNTNLFSCTYFSGLQIRQDGNVMLAYGINDVDYGFSEYSLEKFMGPNAKGV